MKLLLVAAAVAALTCPAAAVTPGTWSHGTEADFAGGEFTKAAVNSRGEISLAREVKILMPSQDSPAVISAVASDGETIYAASGSSNEVYRIVDGESRKLAAVPGTIVTSLTWTAGGLLVGTGGKDAGLYRVGADGAVERVWGHEDVKYVWAVVAGDGGVLYAATGPKARVYAITGDKGEEIYSAAKLAKNILSLVGAPGGKLCAGTDEKGLVIEIDPRAKTGRVILDANEKEIAAIIVAPSGGYFVATSDASKAAGDGKVPPAKTRQGRPVPADATEPAEPQRAAAMPPKDAAGKGAATQPATQPSGTGPAATSAPPERPTTAPAETPPVARPVATSAPAGAMGEPGDGPDEKLQATVELPSQPAGVAASAGGEPRSPGPPPGMRPPSMPAGPSRRRSRPSASGGGGAGNAVYHIQSDGLVRTIFRKPLTILAMMRLGRGKLVLATGNGGALYSVDLSTSVVTRLADTDAAQVTSLAPGPGGAVVFGTANKGSVGLLGGAFAKEGSYVAKALDARQIARWGTVKVRAAVAPGAGLTFATRSGNLAEPDEATWSKWSQERPVDGDFLRIASPPARFLQYRLKLSAGGDLSPVVRQVSLIYQVGNLAPRLEGVVVKATAKPGQRGGAGGPATFRQLAIKAGDPNNDKLAFDIAFRQVGGKTWIQIAEKLDKPMFVWDTRTVGDGTYELRVTASDAPANPPGQSLSAARVSEPVVVDNTAAVIELLAARPVGGTIVADGKAVDAMSRIVAIHYAVDSADEWTAVLPADGICDSRSERFKFVVKDLKAGAHRLAVRVRDAAGNFGYQATTVTIAGGD